MAPRRISNRVAGLLFLALGGAVTGMAAQLPMGSLRLPGPGAFPAAIGLALMALALALLLQTRHAAESADSEGTEPGGRLRVGLVCALVAAFVLALPATGFLLASVVLMVALHAIGAGGRLGVGTVAAGVLTAAAAYALFALILDVPLPRGSFWGY